MSAIVVSERSDDSAATGATDAREGSIEGAALVM